MTVPSEDWEPPSSFEEKMKSLFVPPQLYIWYKAKKELKKGEAEIKLLPFLAPADRVALDIGANKGVWSYMLSQQCSQVHAFEPNPKMFKILERCANSKTTVHKIALSNETKQSELLVPFGAKGYSNQGASLSAVKVSGNHSSVPVDARRLDDMDLGDIGFIKIDVEGFELEVLEGARETLAKYRPNLVIEMEEKHTKLPLETLIGTVCEYGYEAFALNGGALTKFDRALASDHKDHYGNYLFNFIFLPKD
ncbi:MAG: FkbM family methyltransferase [Sneathiella sp.]